jgi:hypothetical protein
LRASIACTRAYSRELLSGLPGGDGPKEVLTINERVARMAHKDPDWVALPLRHPGIDPFGAVLLDRGYQRASANAGIRSSKRSSLQPENAPRDARFGPDLA